MHSCFQRYNFEIAFNYDEIVFCLIHFLYHYLIMLVRVPSPGINAGATVTIL